MADWQRSVVTRRTVEYTTKAAEPYGATWVEAHAMIRAAVDECAAHGGIPTMAEPDDDAIRVHVRGDGDGAQIVASFDQGESREHEAAQEAGLRSQPTDLTTNGRAGQLRAITETVGRVLDVAASRARDRDPAAKLTHEWLDRLAVDGDVAHLEVPAAALSQLTGALDAAGMHGWWTK